MTTKKAEKPAETKPAAETKVAEPVVTLITSTMLAEQLGTKGTTLRRWLRTLPQFQDSGYTRYKWHPVDDAQFLKDAAESFKKHQVSDEEKKAKRLEEVREKATKKALAAESGEKPAKKKKKEKEPEPEPVEDEDFEDDEEGEELE